MKSIDLSLLDQLPNISFLIDKYYNSTLLDRSIALENANLAVDKLKEGNSKEASQLYETAFSTCPEISNEDRAWKSFLAYRYAVCLLKLYNIENLSDLKTINQETQSMIQKIRSLWDYTLKTYNSLDRGFIIDFDKRFPLSVSIKNIKEDRLMR